MPKVKFLKIGPLFVGIMRLVTGIGEGRKDYSLEMGGTHDHLDTLPQSMAHILYFISYTVYALVLQLMLLH